MDRKALIFNISAGIIIALLMIISVRLDIFFPTPVTGIDTIPVNIQIDASDGTNPGAPIEIIEFTDYSCGYCRAAHPELKKVLLEYGESINYAVRYMPASNEGYTAAVAAVCSILQDRFIEFHSSLYKTDDLSGVNIIKIAEDLDMDTEDLIDCMDSEEAQSIIQGDMLDAKSYGISGTPTYIINGDVIVGYRDYDFFSDAVAAQLDPEYIASQILRRGQD